MIVNQSDAVFLLDRLPDLILLLDERGNITYANHRSLELLGNEDELIGKSFRNLVDEGDLARCPEQIEDWIDWRGCNNFPWEISIYLEDGRQQLVSGSAKKLSLPSEVESNINLQGILVSLRPIGKPDSFNIRRDLLIAAVEAADSSIVIADTSQEDLPLIYVNQRFLQLSGYEKAEVLGRNCRFLQFSNREEAIRDEDRADLAKLRKAIKNGTSTNVILRNYRRDGSLFYNDLYITPVYEQERLVAFVGVQNDVTERVQSQEQLQEHQNTISSFFAATDALLGIVELPDGEPIRHVLINDRLAEFFQVAETKASKITLASLGLSPETKTQWQEAFEQCWQTKEAVKFQCELERAEEIRYLRVTVNAIKTEPEATPRCCYVAKDLTDLHTAKTRRMLMEAAVENTEESIVITTPKLSKSENNPEIVYVNKAFTDITGYETQEAIGKTPRILQGAMTDPSVLDRLRKGLIEKQAFRGETINYRKDGRPFVIEWNIAPIIDEEGKTTHWVAAQRDVTRRRQLEKEVLEIQAKEQERIARDLHDSVQQKLNVIGMLSSLIKHQSHSELTPESRKLLKRLFDATKQANDQVRAISHSMYPVSIERNGLMTALQHLATTTEEVFMVNCEFTFEQPILISDRAMATHLYRIVQEAVNNAIRHGGAKQILIGLARKQKENKYTLTISDDGIGISDEVLEAEDRGIGLNSMRYRAEVIDGNFSIKRHKNGGTVVTCAFSC